MTSAFAHPIAIVRATTPLLRLALAVVLALVLASGAFAIGRATASDGPGGPAVTTAVTDSGLTFCQAHVPC